MKDQVNEELRKHFDERFSELWWDLRLPGLGNQTPGQAFEKNPQSVLDYVHAYSNGNEND